MAKLSQGDDFDVSQLFSDDRQQPLKSPTDKDRHKTERIEAEENYLNVSNDTVNNTVGQCYLLML